MQFHTNRRQGCDISIFGTEWRQNIKLSIQIWFQNFIVGCSSFNQRCWDPISSFKISFPVGQQSHQTTYCVQRALRLNAVRATWWSPTTTVCLSMAAFWAITFSMIFMCMFTYSVQYAHRLYHEPNQYFDRTSFGLTCSEPKIFSKIMSLHGYKWIA